MKRLKQYIEWPVMLYKANKKAGILFLSGIVFLIAGFFTDKNFIHNILFFTQGITTFFFVLSLSGMILAAIHFLTGATWSERLLPYLMKPARILVYLPVFIIILTAFFRVHDQQNLESGIQKVYFNSWFLMGRTLLIIFFLYFFSVRFHDCYCKKNIKKIKNLSAVFLFILPFIFIIFTLDWLSGKIPGWINSANSIYYLTGLLSGGLALALFLLFNEKKSASVEDPGFNYHAGRYLTAFISLWAYAWFCRLLITWYAGIPAEAEFFGIIKSWPGYFLFFLNPVLNFIVPFFLLLSKKSKEKKSILYISSIFVLAGRLTDHLLLPGFASRGGFEFFTMAGLSLASAALLLLFISSPASGKNA